jgi:hypothetical protein
VDLGIFIHRRRGGLAPHRSPGSHVAPDKNQRRFFMRVFGFSNAAWLRFLVVAGVLLLVNLPTARADDVIYKGCTLITPDVRDWIHHICGDGRPPPPERCIPEGCFLDLSDPVRLVFSISSLGTDYQFILGMNRFLDDGTEVPLQLQTPSRPPDPTTGHYEFPSVDRAGNVDSVIMFDFTTSSPMLLTNFTVLDSPTSDFPAAKEFDFRLAGPESPTWVSVAVQVVKDGAALSFSPPNPEPSTVITAVLGILGLLGYGWRRGKRVC